jgi:hypothetical protein
MVYDPADNLEIYEWEGRPGEIIEYDEAVATQ